jgi:hypothetical protein
MRHSGCTDPDSIWRNFPAILACVLYAVLGFIHTMYDELLPVWAASDVESGASSIDSVYVSVMSICILRL